MDKQNRVREAAEVRRRPRESAALHRSEPPAIYLSRRGPGIPGAPRYVTARPANHPSPLPDVDARPG